MKFPGRLIALAFFSFAASPSFAACTAATIEGKWSITYADFNSEVGYSTYGIARVTFVASNKSVALIGGRESSFGVVNSGTGSGSYTISSACQGVITLTFGVGSPTVKFDYIVSGTADSPRINFILSEPTNQISGQGFMQKIEL
jgi:hypothetical protein